MKAIDLLDENLIPKLGNGFVGLFVGRSGSGKTCAEASFTKYGKLYIFDSDNRIRGLLEAARWLGKDRMNLIEFDYYNPRDGFKSIDDKLSMFIAQANSGKLEYRTLVFDSIGSLVYMLALDSQYLRGLKSQSGKVRGSVKFLHPDDYNYVSMAFRQLMFNGVMPLAEKGVNIIFSGWLVGKWAKRPGSEDYAPAEEIGERLVGPQNLAEEVIGYFDEVYKFVKEPVFRGAKYTVEFNGSFAKTALGLPSGKFDITGRDFLTVWEEKIKDRKLNEGE